MLVVQDLVVRRSEHFTLGPTSLTLGGGEILGLVGANGSGKTTLMRAVLSALRPTSGSMTWMGHAVRAGTPTPGVVGLIEEPKLLPGLDGIRNLHVAFPQRALDDATCLDVLTRVGLEEAAIARVPARRYSQGMRQRLGLARVLLADAGLLVLDEPTNGLDPLGVRWLRTLLTEQREAGVAIIVSSHMLYEIHQVATRFLMLDHGRSLGEGPIEALGEARTLEDVYFSIVDTHISDQGPRS